MGTQTWCSKRGRRPLSRNPVDSVEGSQISCAALRALAINSREQFIKEQREDPESGHIYRYLENPDDGSVNATVCESWSQDFKLINGLSFTRTRYGAPISLISDNGPQFISDVFEHLSHRLDIKHMKTVTYRPQSNLTERVNRNLVQMIASFVEENHENWDQFLHEFAFALRTAVNETTNKTPAELFLGRKIITPFSKLINVKEDAKYVGNNIEKLFDEARRNMQKRHRYWEKHYNIRRRDVHIKVRVYRPRQSDTISSDSPVETLYDEQEVSHGSNRSNQGQFKEHKKTSSQESEGCRSRQSNTTREIPRNKRKINSTASKDPTIKRSKICRKRSRQGSDHQDRKDTLLNKGKESRDRSLPRSRPEISNLRDLILFTRNTVHCRSIKVA
ncbi:retrovirus-related Pol polyprotein from transposon 17.6 [Trichonephila clavipes]|nr:retrovirus-related Pol polyprotein from transposon 17.6 [Trichonephila clavipes]